MRDQDEEPRDTAVHVRIVVWQPKPDGGHDLCRKVPCVAEVVDLELAWPRDSPVEQAKDGEHGHVEPNKETHKLKGALRYKIMEDGLELESLVFTKARHDKLLFMQHTLPIDKPEQLRGVVVWLYYNKRNGIKGKFAYEAT